MAQEKHTAAKEVSWEKHDEEGNNSNEFGSLRPGYNPPEHDWHPFHAEGNRATQPLQRSNPIAIVRSGNEKPSHLDSSDDDDDSIIDVELDALKIAGKNASRSLPSRLLRAPFLGALPSNDDILNYHNMLPPPMTLSEQPHSSVGKEFDAQLRHDREQPAAYGSLRDSHVRGRFLDGPSSYRDRRTGDIRQIQHRVRFDDHQPSSTALSIGERIRRSRNEQQQRKEETGPDGSAYPPTSTLASILNSTDTAGSPDKLELNAVVDSRMETLAFYDDEYTTRRPQHMLSTSLTGLELLQAGLKEMSIRGGNEKLSSVDDLESETEVGLASNGRNHSISRSFSEPMPQRLRVIHAVTSPQLSGFSSAPLSTFHADSLPPLSIGPLYQGDVEGTEEPPAFEGHFDIDLE